MGVVSLSLLKSAASSAISYTFFMDDKYALVNIRKFSITRFGGIACGRKRSCGQWLGMAARGDGESASAKSDALGNRAFLVATIGTLVLPVRGQLLDVSGVKSSTSRAPEDNNSSKIRRNLLMGSRL